MKLGDLVQFKPVKGSKFPWEFPHPSGLRGRTDELDQLILEGTKGLVISVFQIAKQPDEDDPLDEFPYQVFTILTEDNRKTPGWTENVFDVITEGK